MQVRVLSLAPAVLGLVAQNKLLSILVSRGRPGRLREAVQSFLATRTFAEMLVVLDNDDPFLEQNRQSLEDLDVRVQVGARLGLAQSFNKACVDEAYRYNVLGLSADDVIFRTQGWDERFFEALYQHYFAGVVYGDDKIQGKKLCTHPYFGSVIPRALGRVLPPDQKHLYIDNNFMCLGQMMRGLEYLPDVVIEHMHSSVHPEFQDQGYAEVNSQSMYDHDRNVHNSWREGDMRADANSVLKLAQCLHDET